LVLHGSRTSGHEFAALSPPVLHRRKLRSGTSRTRV
jgi:hypothetical protein